MNELVLPFKVNVKVGKTKNRYDRMYNIGGITIKTKYKVGLAVGLCWLSFKIFFMGVKKLIG